MKKFLFWFFLLVALGAIGYFVGYPYVMDTYFKPKTEEDQGPDLISVTSSQDSLFTEGWVEPEVFVYTPRDIPSLEAEFYELGYPRFYYLTDEMGQLDKREKSYHEDGMEVFLEMNDAIYMTHAEIDYGVLPSKFNSTSMKEHIQPFLDFIRIITNHEVSDEDERNLLRVFTNVFNDAESKNNTITINQLEFKVSLDNFYKLIILSC